MSPALFHNENRHCVITDFPQTFQIETGLTMASSCDIIQDSNSVFHGFSYLIKHLLSLIDFARSDSYAHIPCESFTIKGLTSSQRKKFYIELFRCGINYTKTKYLNVNDNHSHSIGICINTTNLWSVVDFRINNQNSIYHHYINVFNTFYSHVNILGITTCGDIIVSMAHFIIFKRIYMQALDSYYRLYSSIPTTVATTIPNTIPTTVATTIPNTVATTVVTTIPNTVATTIPNTIPTTVVAQDTHPVSSNTNIKQQLSDLIFDIRHDLTDAKYKEILEKIAVISP
jgi:hypothetical protein